MYFIDLSDSEVSIKLNNPDRPAFSLFQGATTFTRRLLTDIKMKVLRSNLPQ